MPFKPQVLTAFCVKQTRYNLCYMYHVPCINQMYTFFKKTNKHVGGYYVIRLRSYTQVHLLGFFKDVIQYNLFTLNSAFIVLSYVYRTCHDQIQYLFQIQISIHNPQKLADVVITIILYSCSKCFNFSYATPESEPAGHHNGVEERHYHTK